MREGGMLSVLAALPPIMSRWLRIRIDQDSAAMMLTVLAAATVDTVLRADLSSV